MMTPTQHLLGFKITPAKTLLLYFDTVIANIQNSAHISVDVGAFMA